MLYSSSTNLRIAGIARRTFSVSMQYAIRKYPGQPNVSPGTSTRSYFIAFLQNATRVRSWYISDFGRAVPGYYLWGCGCAVCFKVLWQFPLVLFVCKYTVPDGLFGVLTSSAIVFGFSSFSNSSKFIWNCLVSAGTTFNTAPVWLT